MLQFAVLNKLRPELATYVTQRQPENMADLLQAARIAELTLPVSNDTELHDKFDRLMADWDKLSTSHVAKGRPPSPAPSTSFPMPPKRVTFEDNRYSFPNGRPRSAVPRQVNPRHVNPNSPRMNGPFGPDSSMQGMSYDARQRYGTTHRALPEILRCNDIRRPHRKRNIAPSAGEGFCHVYCVE